MSTTLFQQGLEVSDKDLQILLYNLRSIEQIEEWLRQALETKLNHSKAQMLADWQNKLYDQSDSNWQPNLPATKDGLLEHILNRPDYISRVEKAVAVEQAQMGHKP